MSYQNLPNRIYLIGLPSSGKSTFGEILAQFIDYKFVDTDAWIVQNDGREIPQIFAENGEDYFRKLEQKSLLETQNLEKSIISTGGGMPCFFDNMAVMNHLGCSVFLNVLPQTIVQRIGKNDDSRPLLKTQNQADILPQIQQKYDERIHYYRQANLILDEKNIQPSILINQIQELNNIG